MLKKERPVLLDLVNEGTTEIEKFQNEVVRPVIKMQHDLICAVFENYLQKKKIIFESLSKEKQATKIKGILTKDVNFKNMILGCIVGSFSAKELSVYFSIASEINRRIIQITIQRLQDSF